MGNAAAVLAWLQVHSLEVMVSGIGATQGLMWWMLHRAIARIRNVTTQPPQPATPPVLRFVERAVEDPMARRLVTRTLLKAMAVRLRGAFEANDENAILAQQTRMARAGANPPPQTIEEVDQFLGIRA